MGVLDAPFPTRARAFPRRRENGEITAARHVDYGLIVLPVLLSLIGLVMIYSSTRLHHGTYYVERQAIAVVIGLVGMFIVMSIDYRKLREFWPLVYVAMLPLLVGVLVLGASRKGAQAWFQIGPLQFEPSEVSKIAVVIAIAGYCHQHRGDLDAWRLAIVVMLAAVPIGLVLLQNDLGSAFVIAVAAVAMLLVSGIRGRHMVVLLLLALSGVIAAVSSGYLAGYRLDRLTTFADNSTNITKNASPTAYNTDMALSAVASGGLTGQGLFHGTQTKLGYVPEQRTDFIFTVVGEELGFVGGAVVILLYALLVWRLFRISLLSSDFFGTLVCMGVLAIVAFQVFENIGMCMKIMPVTGIPLPFMSYGGSSVIATFLAIGLVTNVHMRRFS
ncbi:MAG: Cell division protein FtsW [Actinomycetia bacterium]|nr:Cell division protein FtsW [Actinomycetes bacterium]